MPPQQLDSPARANIIGNRSHFSDLSVLLQFMLRRVSDVQSDYTQGVAEKTGLCSSLGLFSCFSWNRGQSRCEEVIFIKDKKWTLGKNSDYLPKPTFCPNWLLHLLYDTKVTILFYAISTIKLPPSMIISWFSTQPHKNTTFLICLSRLTTFLSPLTIFALVLDALKPR